MIRILAVTVATLFLYGCAAPTNTVIFVTNTSFGVNAEKTPPSVSVAYDREEGYIGPRAKNGVMPPVVASIQTGGNVFEPKVRQVYATGQAAVIASTGSGTVDNGDMNELDNTVAVFGTATTIGLKAGFDANGSPDSLLFGFKRKELSVIPLGQKDGVPAYPSVLASIDTTASAASLQGTGLTISQYFATGKAAEALALNNPSVKAAFNTITSAAATATLTPAQISDAQARAAADIKVQQANVDKVMGNVAPGGTLDHAKLANLIAKANQQASGSVNTALNSVGSASDLRTLIGHDEATTSALAKAANN